MSDESRDVDEPSSDEDVFKTKKPRQTSTSNKQSKSNSVPSSVKNKPRFECSKCNKTFAHLSSLSKHKKCCGVGVVCENCLNLYSNFSNFTAHKKKCSSSSSSRYTNCIHPDCDNKFYTKSLMVDHLERHHFVDCNVKHLEFESFSEFLEWKDAEDRSNFVTSVLHSGVKAGSVTYRCFSCNFDVQKRKGVSSRKIPNYDCPARMLLREDPKGFHCKYISGHNHSLKSKNLKYHRLSKDTINAIKSETILGIPASKIQDHLRPPNDGESFFPTTERLITLKQISNIQYKLKKATQLHKDDAKSVDMIVEEMKEKEEILIYKPQNDKTVIGPAAINNLPDNESLFILGYQNKRMRNELLAGATRVVCIDATHKTNQFDFQLLNIIVPDEYGVGYPVAHFISNKMDAPTIEMMLQSFKEKNPKLKMNIVMKDDDQALENALNTVFPDVDQYLCSWHMRRTFLKQLNSHVKDPLLYQSMKAHIDNLIYEKNSNDFESMLKNFIEIYSADPRSKSFIDYFVTYHAGRTKFWAHCFRNKPHGDTDTNMFCESFHNVLKGPLYLKRKVNARIDFLLKVLVDFEFRKHIDLLGKRIKEEPPKGFKNQTETHDRHIRGLKISDDHVVQIPESESEWKVNASKSDSKYLVTKFYEVCPIAEHCFVKCDVNRECSKLCMHLYTCNCPDLHPLCKHIHKVHAMRLRLNPDPAEEERNDAVGWTIHQEPCESNFPNYESTNTEAEVQKCKDLLQQISAHLQHECVTKNLSAFIKGTLMQIDVMCQSEIKRNSKEQLDRDRIIDENNEVQEDKEGQEESEVVDADRDVERSSDFGAENADESLMNVPVLLEVEVHDTSMHYEERPHPTFCNPQKIAPNQKAVKQRVLFRTLKRKTLVTNNKMRGSSKKDLVAAKNQLLHLKSSLTTDQIMDRTDYDLESLTKVQYTIHNIPIQLLFLKSINDEISIEEADALSYLTKKEFVRGWLYEAIVNAFLLIVLEDETDRLAVPAIKSAIISSREFSTDDCLAAFEDIDFSAKEEIFFPCNPEGNHWMLLVTNISDRVIYFLDSNRPSCVVDMFREVTSVEEPVLHLHLNNSSIGVVFTNDSYNRLVCRWRMILNSKLGLSNQQWNVKIPEHVRQENAIDCGVFVSWFCERIVLDGDITTPFSTHDYRMYMLRNLLSSLVPVTSS